MDTYTVTKRLWLTADKEHIVEEGDPAAAFLYATPGKKVPLAEAVKYRLVKAGKPVEAKQADPPENKAVSIPANKAKRATKKKG